ncbi:hypothetical protein Ancab_017349 [Ancistrocladus abbreviatus]
MYGIPVENTGLSAQSRCREPVGNLQKRQTVGVIGAGRIGSAYARMTISLHPDLDRTTYHLVNKERLSTMKKEAILINCSRVPVNDEAALTEHLKANPMFRVGLDVFEIYKSSLIVLFRTQAEKQSQ